MQTLVLVLQSVYYCMCSLPPSLAAGTSAPVRTSCLQPAGAHVDAAGEPCSAAWDGPRQHLPAGHALLEASVMLGRGMHDSRPCHAMQLSAAYLPSLLSAFCSQSEVEPCIMVPMLHEYMLAAAAVCSACMALSQAGSAQGPAALVLTSMKSSWHRSSSCGDLAAGAAMNGTE